jgi:hypothetical protein
MPNNREQKFNEDGAWQLNGRQEARPAKLIRDILHPKLIAKISESELTQFTRSVNANDARDEITFHETTIEEAYSYNNNRVDSCMAGEAVHVFYNMYGCRALVAKNKDKYIVGRAIIWPEVHIGNDVIQLMDRVYVSSERYAPLFIEYADEKGWYHKKNQSSCNSTIVSPTGEESTPIMEVQRIKYKRNTATFIPYVDTMSYRDANSKILSNALRHQKNVCRQMYSTDGDDFECSGYNFVKGAAPDRVCTPNEIVTIGGEKHYRYGKTVCQIGTQLFLKTDPKVIQLPNVGWILKRDAVKVGKNWYSKKSRMITKVNGKWRLTRNVKKKHVIKKVKNVTPIDAGANDMLENPSPHTPVELPFAFSYYFGTVVNTTSDAAVYA